MCSMFLGLTPKPDQSLKQLQRLMMSPQMQQAINLMQLPLAELAEVVEAELELNPLLESRMEMPEEEIREENQDQDRAPEQELDFHDKDFDVLKQLDEDFQNHFSESENYYIKRNSEEEKNKAFAEQSIPVEETLFEHLMEQARETFLTTEELAMAEILIGSFDESGLLHTSISELSLFNNFDKEKLAKVLEKIKTFHPFGVGASSLQESLLIQLQCKGKEDSKAYVIIEKYYDDILKNRLPAIAKHMDCSIEEVHKAISTELIHLDLHPGTLFSRKPAQYIVADATIRQDDETLVVLVNDDHLPSFRFNSRYLRMLDDPTLSAETKEFIKGKIMSAKWLLKNIEQRNQTIHRILLLISEKQKNFFLNSDGELIPLTMKTLAQELSLHESTIARAVANKYVETPRGLLPMRYFFSNQYVTAEGDDLSAKTVRSYLKKIIDNENKMKPLSDETISKMMHDQGIPCARRTIAKYRTEMNIGNTKQRKQY